jgi:hypothetical protein
MMAFITRAVFDIVVVVGLATTVMSVSPFASCTRRKIFVVVLDQATSAALAAVNIIVVPGGAVTTAGLRFDASCVVVVAIILSS